VASTIYFLINHDTYISYHVSGKSCVDDTAVNCKDTNICAVPTLKVFCPLACGLCGKMFNTHSAGFTIVLRCA
jgi:hypothetical protein